MHKIIVDFIKDVYGAIDFVPLAVPVFIGNEKKYLNECIDSTFVSSVGKFVDRFEEDTARYTGCKRAVVCVSGTKIIETREDELMTALQEKPDNTYMINTGVYLLNAECINEISEGDFFHITHLMEKTKARGGRVGCFPVSEHAWRDMGEWTEYLKMINVL